MDQLSSDTLKRALSPGETTSEHAVMVASGAMGKVMMIIGMLSAALPQLLEFTSMAPDALKNSKYGAIIIAVIGTLIAIIGAAKKLLTEISYIQGRSLVKAAAVRDITSEPSAPVVNDNTGKS